MSYPSDLKYTKEHEWIKADGSGATVGITDYAQESLGDIVFVDLPKPGSEITAGKTFGTVESVKAVSDLYSPVGGEVVPIQIDSICLHSDSPGASALAASIRAAFLVRGVEVTPFATAGGR